MSNDEETPMLFDDDQIISPYAENDSDMLDEDIQKPSDDNENESPNNNDSQKDGIKKKGRPKGTKPARPYRPSYPKKLVLTFDGQQNGSSGSERLPKMRSNVSHLKLTIEQVDELKKDGKNFYQPGVCFVIAPNLHQCIECLKQKRRQRREVDCRFYQFRKLRYEGDKVVVAGFLDPYDDPKDVDKSIWMPQPDKLKFKSLSVTHAILILTHVGDELCMIIAKERSYYEKYKSDSKLIIWKRLIDGVVEKCDLCSTTLFNYHLICTNCGLSLCIDCANEKSPNLDNAQCSIKDKKHSYDELHLTQIITTDCMEKMQRMLHDICKSWKIQHDCTLKTEKILEIDKMRAGVVRNILFEIDDFGKTFLHRELGHIFKQVEVDLKSIKYDGEQKEAHEFPGLVQKRRHIVEHIRPIRYHTKTGNENVISISRSMSQAASDVYYKDIPHKWLCENKLLRLLDPLHLKNEDFFHDQWQRGQPVLISNVLQLLDRKLWLPQSFSQEFGKERSDLINCMNGNLVRNKEIAVFWDGFEIVEKRLRDNEGTPMLLKLKDWPPDSDFKKTLPSRFEDFMKNLPMNSYTNRTGDLNIIKYLPQCFIHPDLGPKG